MHPFELTRLNNLLVHERELYQQNYQCLIGIDEAGRGPLAGPVVAAAINIPNGLLLEGINDSKQVKPALREKIFEILTKHPDIHYGIGIIDAPEIDKINILRATIKAMHMAYSELSVKPDYALIDGLKLQLDIPNDKIIKGDSKSYLIAAASILAKVTRDRLMQKYHEKWPEFHFDSHKGYGTKKHRDAILENGICPIHRKSFEPIKSIILGGRSF